MIRAGQFAQAARQGAIILIALALPRLGVEREVIGQWEGLLFVGYVLGFGWLTGLLQAYLVEVRTIRPERAAAFSRRGLLVVGGISAIFLLVAAGLHEPLFHALRLGDAPPGWFYFFIFLLTYWPGLFFEQVLTIRDRPVLLAAFGAAGALGQALCLVLPLYYGAGLAHALFVLAVFGLAKGLFVAGWVIVDSLRDASPQPRAPGQEETKNWLRAAWPLIIYATTGAAVTAFDPWFVNYWYGGDEATFAVFRYGARELPFLAAITNGALVVVLPRLTEAPAAGLDLLKASSRRLMHWIFGGAIFLMLTAGWWWTVVFTETFADSLPLFRAYLFVVASRLLFPVPVLTARGHTRMLMVFGGAELLLNLVFSLLLAPHFGLLGIIWATVIAYFLDKLGLMWYLKWRTGIGPGRYTDWRWYGGYLTGLVVGYWIVSG